MSLQIIKGDLIHLFQQNKFDVIIHQCNCFHTMGSGIAAQLKHFYPEIFEADKTTGYGDINKLGCYIPVQTDNGIIINCYSQYHIGTDFGCPTSYEAMKRALTKIASEYQGKRIGTYWLGCGLGSARQDWVKDIIENTIAKSCNVTIVEYQPF